MDARALVVERGLVAPAVRALTARALSELGFESLGPTKACLKRFLSAQPWGPSDDEALADAVGPGEGRRRERLDDDVVLDFGWVEGRFRLRADGPDPGAAAPEGPVAGADGPAAGDAAALAATFEGDIVPEATPSPRTLAFRTGPVSDASREYRSAAEAADPRVARLFQVLPELVSVLVARDFVALTLRHPDRWADLLVPALATVREQFSAAEPASAGPRGPGLAPAPGPGAAAPPGEAGARRRHTRLDRAWRELGALRATEPEDLGRLLEASSRPDAASRQVAAGLLGEAPAAVAGEAWTRLLGDPSRMVRRAVVDAVVAAGRESLRPATGGGPGRRRRLVRWKALRGLAELGAGPSREVVQPLTGDSDFRVRLEPLAALRR